MYLIFCHTFFQIDDNCMGKPTKDGTTLSLQRFCTLLWASELIKTAFYNDDETSLHLGGNFFAVKDKHVPFLVIAKYAGPYQSSDIVSDCIVLTTNEVNCLFNAEIKIRNAVPELNELRPCYMAADHQNQTGYLLCSECNPTPDNLEQVHYQDISYST